MYNVQPPVDRISRTQGWITSSGQTFKNLELGNLQWTEFNNSTLGKRQQAEFLQLDFV